ncbi:MAG: type VII secretion protein EccE [Gordonia sp. (in: high G+C Gram-positive bacteria)]|uniref:type VII secretion protein EccE n=1 Tax=Gordonia sp. (in: high G+C Gram-positive bacteria) TaxID=84139 RepID=UPI0039E31FC7
MGMRGSGVTGRRTGRDARRRRPPAPAPFDVPCGPDLVGVRYTGPHLTTTLAVRPGPVRPRRLDGSWFDAAAPGLPLAGLLDWLARPDAAATSLTLLTRGSCCLGDGPASSSYRTLLGPLPLAARRDVRLQIRTDPFAHPELTARYGTGPSAALRACLSATRRAGALLREAGLGAVPLTAAELTAADDWALDGGARPAGGSPEPPHAYRIAAPDAAALAATLESVWTRTGGTALTALDLRPARSAPRVRALLRLDDALRTPAPVTWQPFPNAPDVPLPDGTAQDLRGAVCPVDGDGIVLGADAHGRPVGLRPTGPDIARTRITGRLSLVQQTVVRLVATGVSAAVFTDRPERWAGLLDAVADRTLLHAASAGGADVLVDDRPGARLGPLDGHTVLCVNDDARTADPGGGPSLCQDPDDPAFAEVCGGDRRIRVRLVATPAENALLGA